MRTVGIVSPGAMGSAIGAALLRGGARVVATVAGRSGRTARLTRDSGLELLPSLADVVAVAEVVLSIVPPDQAEAVAVELSRARLMVDLNAVSPATARRISDEVDGSISGPPPHRAGTTRIYLSGPRAGEVAALPFDGVDVIVIGDVVGAASAVKMSTASVYKGSIALLAQALRAADHYGVVEHVLSDLGELADGAGGRIARSAAKADRYIGEMHEIAAAQAAAGLEPALFEAMAEVWAGIARTPLGRVAPEDAGSDLDETLRQLGPLVQRELPELLEVRDADPYEP
jgi:3-hydroxyisobutyrate dehydrogenase-like beta-hydroxyacid dehydrogenase